MPALPTLTPQEFVAKWRQADVKARSDSQEHVIDLCRLIGHPTPVETDPASQSCPFEVWARAKGTQLREAESGLRDTHHNLRDLPVSLATRPGASG